MRAWTGPDLPTPFSGPQVRVFDTASGEVQTTSPDGTARLYVCGITPYDATHIGHANTFLSFDLLVRAWRSAGHQVHYVQNITDVDDPLLERAAQTGVDWAELAAEQIDLFRSDMAALRVIPPTDYIGAVESIPLIVEMISRLEAAGAVYRVEDDLYFSVTADPDFGEVSGWGREQMIRVFPARGGDPDRVGKKDPLDCLLWRAERPGEPSWPSLYGPGRPGWHVECAAIATAHLGPAFDIQGGGRDLVFPHHEMTASEAHVVEPGQRFAHAYVHTGMVGLDGEKMSKSRGNLVFVSRLLGDGHDPMAIRLALLSQHYREDWDWSSSLLDVATSRLLRWRAACRAEAGPDPTPVVGAVLEALADDLDAPRALAAVDDWVAQVISPRMDGSSAGREHRGWHAAAPEVVRRLVNASLGVAL